MNEVVLRRESEMQAFYKVFTRCGESVSSKGYRHLISHHTRREEKKDINLSDKDLIYPDIEMSPNQSKKIKIVWIISYHYNIYQIS